MCVLGYFFRLTFVVVVALCVLLFVCLCTVVSMHEWRQSKRKGQMESQLTSISKDVSTVIDEMSHVKSSATATEKQVDAMTLKMNSTLKMVENKLNAITKALGGSGGGGGRMMMMDADQEF